MIVRAATAVSFPVLFSSGHPDGTVDWEVRDQSGALLDSGSIAVAAEAVSTVITVLAASNTLAVGELTSTRDVSWTYTVSGIVINGEERYRVEARLPFGVSAEGVRAKLGVDKTDLPDSDVPLATAYYDFEAAVGSVNLAAVTDPADQLIVANAIEARAALALLPTMTVRVAAKESSGTNQYQRQKIDWEAVRLSLEAAVNAGYTLVIPGFDPTTDFGPLLILASPETDVLTGAEGGR